MQLDASAILIWGVVATIVLNTIMATAQGFGISRMSLPFMIGTVFTDNRDRAQIIGFFCSFIIGWGFALLYAFIFESLQIATWWLGLAISFIHWLFLFSAVMPLLAHLHPRIANEHIGPEPTRMLEPPGFMALNYGRRTPLVALAAHLCFGLILGACYRLSLPML